MRRQNLAGTRFGRWLILGRIEQGRCNRWMALCDCGRQRIVAGSHLRSGVSRSCGCRTVERVQKPFGVSARNSVLNHYKHHARIRGLTWLITDELFYAVTRMPCHYCGLPPANKQSNPGGFFIYSGLDRKDSARGYEESNIVPCCEECNRAKSKRSYEAFVAWIERIRLFRNKGIGMENALDCLIAELRK